jgi:hypothetical protein
MGFLDKIKGKVKDAMQNEVPPPPVQAAAPAEEYDHGHEDHEEASSGGSDEEFDLAGFDPLNDEEGFYNAVLHMESEGQFGGTDESRAEIMQQRGSATAATGTPSRSPATRCWRSSTAATRSASAR